MVSELVDEDVRRLVAVRRDRAVEPEDAAAAVGARVRQNLDEFVRRKRRGFTQLPVLEREDVTLRAEGVVRRAERRAAVDARRRPRNAGFDGWWHESPHIELAAVLLVRR